MATLTLKTLYCHETEDWTGADEPYLRVNGKTVWSGSLNDEQDTNLLDKNGNLLTFALNGQATIKLFDKDFGWFDDDDFLGQVEVTTQEIGLGDQIAFFTLDGANYELTYTVTA